MGIALFLYTRAAFGGGRQLGSVTGALSSGASGGPAHFGPSRATDRTASRATHRTASRAASSTGLGSSTARFPIIAIVVGTTGENRNAQR